MDNGGDGSISADGEGEGEEEKRKPFTVLMTAPSGETTELPSGTTTLGRGLKYGISDRRVSRKHAEIAVSKETNIATLISVCPPSPPNETKRNFRLPNKWQKICQEFSTRNEIFICQMGSKICKEFSTNISLGLSVEREPFLHPPARRGEPREGEQGRAQDPPRWGPRVAPPQGLLLQLRHHRR